MRYYKATNPDTEDSYFYESKKPLSDKGVLRALIDQGDLDSIDAPDFEVVEIAEEEYEENSY